MNYYNRFPGDYARDTKHLSLDEHGAYTLLLDTIYATEKPLPKDLKLLFRLCNANTKRQQNAVKSVLSEFFFKKPTGFSNKRFERELKRSRIRIKAARENGRTGGRPHKKQKGGHQKEQNENQVGKFRSIPEKPAGFPEHAENIGKTANSTEKTKPNGNPTHNPAKSSPSPILHPTNTTKHSSNLTFSQDTAAAVLLEGNGAAAAFSDIGFDEPFGQPKFQEVWLQNHSTAKAQGEWVTMAMERTIQQCQEKEIRVPPQFYSAKRTVESFETEEFNRRHQRTPL